MSENADLVPITGKVQEETRDRLDDYADEWGISRSAAIRRLLLERLKSDGNESQSDDEGIQSEDFDLPLFVCLGFAVAWGGARTMVGPKASSAVGGTALIAGILWLFWHSTVSPFHPPGADREAESGITEA